MKKNKLTAYSMEFASYIVSKSPDIDKIILFGSISRGDFDDESDIDIFISMKNVTKKKEKEIKKIADEYYTTEAHEKWKLLGIENEFSLIIGDIDSPAWENLKRSIMTDGITLYGKYISAPKKLRHFVVISYEPIKDDKKRVNLHRRLFGYKSGAKHYHGIVEKEGGIKISSGSFMIPIESYRKTKKMMDEMKVSTRVIEIWKD